MINWIVTSSVLILVVAGLRFVLRGKISLRLQYALWFVVLFRLLVPFDFGESSISMMNVVEQVPVVQEMDAVRNVETMERLNNGQVRIVYNVESQPGIPVTEILDMPEESYRQQKRSLNYHKITMGVWTAGMAVMFAIFIFTNLRLYCMLKKDREELKIDMTSLPVYVTRAVETPCLFGDLNPAIYVTPEVAENETVLRHTILHEMMHYRHHDLYWGFLRCVALSMHWYNPLVWWAAKLSKDDAELACDEAVIRKLGEEERYAYGKTLIEMTRPGRNTLLGTATTMTGSKSALKERIERIAKKPKMAAYTLAAVVVIAVAVVACTMTGAENREFENWLKGFSTEGITAHAVSGYAEDRVQHTLSDSELEYLCGIFRSLEKKNLKKEDWEAGIPDYCLTLYEVEAGRILHDFILKVEDEDTVTLHFDRETSELFGVEEGEYWHIESAELAGYIMELAEKTDVKDFMRTVQADDFTEFEMMGAITREALAKTLNLAALRGTMVDEATLEDYVELWDIWVQTGAAYIRIGCGLPENCISAELIYPDYRSTVYFEDQTLYELIRYEGHGAGYDYKNIESEHYERFEPLLIAEMEEVLERFKTNPGGSYDYEPLKFYYESSYTESDGSVVEQYLFTFGILAENPAEARTWWSAGSAMVDCKLRLTGASCGGVFAVRWRNGELAAHALVKGNFSYDPDAPEPYPGYGKYQRKILKTELDTSEFGGV